MGVQTQKAAFPLDAAPRSLAHGRRGARRSKHFTQFLTCRTTPQKLQASTHSGNKSAYPSWFRKHPQLHLAAEMARSPAAPGLLFTTAAVHGFTIVSEVVSNLVDKGSIKAETLSTGISNLVDKGSIRAETLGTGINRQLQQASDSIATQTEVSQHSFQEWKDLMFGILSEEASKVQAELDHASKTGASWQQQSAEVVAQVASMKPELKAHPLGLPQVKMSELESGWLVDALQQRFPEPGSSSAWPTSYSVAAGSDSSSDSMSLSDEEDAKTASLTSMSRFMEQAKDLANWSPDVARTRTAVLDRNMSQFGSAASQLVTSVVSKAVQFPGQRFGVSNFSPSRSPEHVSSKIGQTGPSSRKRLAGPASPTAFLPSTDTAAALPTASAPQTAADLPSPARPAAALPSASASATATLPAAASPVTAALSSPYKAAAALPTASASSAAALPTVSASPTTAPLSFQHKAAAALPTASASSTASLRTASASSTTSALPSPHKAAPALPPASASSTAALPTASASPTTALLSSPCKAAAAPPTASASSTAATLPSASAAQPASYQMTSPDPKSATQKGAAASARSPTQQAMRDEGAQAKGGVLQAMRDVLQANRDARQAQGDVHQGKRDVPQAKEDTPQASIDTQQARDSAPQLKGDTPQAKEEGAERMATADGPKAAGNNTLSEVHPVERQRHFSSKGSTQAQLLPGDVDTAEAQQEKQHEEQPKAKTPLKPVRVVRPEPTPNWRAPRPLTPPPTPVQQGHPLSASSAPGAHFQPASGAQFHSDSGQQWAPLSDSARPTRDSAAEASPSVQAPSRIEDSSPSHGMDLVTESAVGPSSVSGDSPATETPGHVSAKHGAVQSLASSSSTSDQSSTPRQQPTTAAAATAVDPTTTTVVDSIPWGASGTATARGRQVSPQTGSGGSSITGGTTGGSGGGSPRPSGGSGGDDDGNKNSSTWQHWWLRLLLVGGGATAVSMSSTVRTAIMNAVAAIRARLAPVKKKKQQQEEEEVQEEEDKEVQEGAQAAPSTDKEDGIATNIKVKEGDTAWSIAEEFSGGGTAWPEVVSSNPHADTAKPTTGMTLRVSVRL